MQCCERSLAVWMTIRSHEQNHGRSTKRTSSRVSLNSYSVCWLVIETSLTFISSLVCSQPVHSDLQLVNNVMWWFSENFVQGYFELTLIVGAVLPLKWCKITNLRFAFEMLFPPVNWKCTACNKSRNIFDKLPVTVFRRALKTFFF